MTAVEEALAAYDELEQDREQLSKLFEQANSGEISYAEPDELSIDLAYKASEILDELVAGLREGLLDQAAKDRDEVERLRQLAVTNDPEGAWDAETARLHAENADLTAQRDRYKAQADDYRQRLMVKHDRARSLPSTTERSDDEGQP